VTNAWYVVGIALLAWAAVTAAYVAALRRELERHAAAVRADVAEVSRGAREWQVALERATHRQLRNAAVSIGHALDALAEARPVAAQRSVAAEIRLLLRDHAALIARDGGLATATGAAAMATLAGALEQTALDEVAYDAFATDGAFACERFPLSVFARLGGLRARTQA